MGSPPFLLSFCFVGLSWLLSFNAQKKKIFIFLFLDMKGLDVLKLMLLFFFDNSIAGDGDLC